MNSAPFLVGPFGQHKSDFTRSMSRNLSINDRISTRIQSSFNEGQDSEKKQLTPETVAEMIEVSFVNACMQLSQGYVDVLKLFIVSVQTGYDMNLFISDLSQKLKECPNLSARRPLLEEETNLRMTWINMIYMALEELQANDDIDAGKSVTTDMRAKFGTFVKNVLKERKQGKTMRDLKLNIEELIEDELERERCLNDPLAKAIYAQSCRLLFLIPTVLEEEKICLDDKLPTPPPPPIPGAF